ncbi:MAG: RlmE family RNA methyltransferase [Candidatus Hadarchaeales archaeon]
MVKSRRKDEDGYYRMAKKLGYRSRAAFKLLQLDERYSLIKKGDVVVDLGAAPGGWMQVAAEKVGSAGFVLGVDVQPIEKFPEPNVVTLIADITKENTAAEILKILPRRADVVLSDVSPKITGVWSIDHSRSIELTRASLDIAEKILAPGGNILMKVFQGDLLQDFLAEVKEKFTFFKASKPRASRKESAEVYLIGKGFISTNN